MPLVRISLIGAMLFLLDSAGADDTISFKVRIQPRADLGGFSSGAREDYRTQLDFYMRRSRLELLGRPVDGVYYILAVSGDRWGQRGASGGGDVAYAFVNYRLGPSVELRAGLVKLPYSRGALVSSSRILLIERTRTIGNAASAFGHYITPHLTLHGRLRDKSVGYYVAVMDGLQPGDSDRFTRASVSSSENSGMVARLEFSPDGWIEGRESDSHLGVGRHLTVALNGAFQNGIVFGEVREDRLVWGGDFSFHRDGLTVQTEYLQVDRDGPNDFSPAGWYVQIGKYISGLKLEPAARFERFDSDLPGGGDVVTVYTGGLNWYRNGHDLKFMANIVHTRFERRVRELDDASSRTLLQLHSQLYF